MTLLLLLYYMKRAGNPPQGRSIDRRNPNHYSKRSMREEGESIA